MKRIALALVLLAAVSYAIMTIVWGNRGEAPGAPSRELAAAVLLAAALVVLVLGLRLETSQEAGRSLLVARDGKIGPGGRSERTISARRRLPVVVLGGQAAVVERLGRFSRVLLPGQSELQPGESIARAINTRPRTLAGSVDAASRDGVPLSVEFQVEAQIIRERLADSGRQRSGVPQAGGRELLPSREAVRRATYGAPNWELAVLHAARAALRQVLAQTRVNEIYDLSERGRDSSPFAVIADGARTILDEQAQAWGATVTRARLNRIKLPAEVVEAAVSGWAERHKRELEMMRPAQTISASGTPEGGETRPGSRLKLAPIIGRGPFVSLREASRNRLGYVSTTELDIGGSTHRLTALPAGGESEPSLHPDRTYFAMQVGAAGLPGTAQPNEIVVLEPGDTLLDQRVVAIADAGDMVLGQVQRREGHQVITTDVPEAPRILLADDSEVLATCAARYEADGLAVRPLLTRDARVVGVGQYVLKPISSAPRPLQPPEEAEMPAQDEAAVPSDVADEAATDPVTLGGLANG